MRNVFHKIKTALAGTPTEAKKCAVHFGISRFTPPNFQIFQGAFDQITYLDGMLKISGWMLSIHGPYDEYVLNLNGTKKGRYDRVLRKDIAEEYPTIENADKSGFRFTVQVPKEELDEIAEIEVKGLKTGVELACMQTGFMKDLYTHIPTPPTNLIQRIDGFEKKEDYLLKGIQTFQEFRKIIEKHAADIPVERILDWRCGIGRLTAFFYYYSTIPELFACGMDEEAITWLQSAYPKATFDLCKDLPPTNYQPNFFDLVVSYSVMRDFKPHAQMQWAKEIQRILKPGGLFITVVSGITAARTQLDEEEMAQFIKTGLFDLEANTSVQNDESLLFSPGVFLTPAFCKETFSPLFSVLEYKEQGAGHHYDIVVFQKRNP
jgi:SAM-dependent methyltransferase